MRRRLIPSWLLPRNPWDGNLPEWSRKEPRAQRGGRLSSLASCFYLFVLFDIFRCEYNIQSRSGEKDSEYLE